MTERELTEREEQLEDALLQIKQWADAYPEDIFTTPDLDKMREILTANGMPTALDAAHGTWGRHIAEGVGKIATEALGAPPDETEAAKLDAGRRERCVTIS